MLTGGITKRFLKTTRGQVIALLRRGAQTVEDLARALGVTDNAIRAHLTALERDGLVRQQGIRRPPGAGKPASVYAVPTEAEPLFSHAYAPVLGAVLDELAEELPQARRKALMQAVGRRLAAALPAPPSGGLDARVRAAVALFGSLGADLKVERRAGTVTLRGCTGCPLSTVVSRRPEICQTLASLLSEFLGTPVLDCCDRGEGSRCCFEIRGVG